MKSFFIILYLCLIFSGGFLNLLENKYASFFFPYTNWPMFDTYSSYHHELVVYGKIENSEKKLILSLGDFFPMNPLFVNRGNGAGFSTIRFSKKSIILSNLCNYLLKEYNQDDRENYLSKIEIKSRYWLLREGENNSQESLLVECSK